jgi:hypothetical protein
MAAKVAGRANAHLTFRPAAFSLALADSLDQACSYAATIGG